MLFVRNLQVNLHKKGHIWTKLHFGVLIISNNAPKFTYCSQKSVKKSALYSVPGVEDAVYGVSQVLLGSGEDREAGQHQHGHLGL